MTFVNHQIHKKPLSYQNDFTLALDAPPSFMEFIAADATTKHSLKERFTVFRLFKDQSPDLLLGPLKSMLSQVVVLFFDQSTHFINYAQHWQKGSSFKPKREKKVQDYIDLAEKNGVALLDKGECQFCGANTKRGVHECIEIFNLGFQDIDFSNPENYLYRFLIVDAHTLQHPEIHGRWNNHFHLTRLHLIFKYNIEWTYQLSPQLSDYLNKYKIHKQDEYLIPPKILERGVITTTDILEKSNNEAACKVLIKKWAVSVYDTWERHHGLVDLIAKGFLNIK